VYASKEYGGTDVIKYAFGVGEHRAGNLLENWRTFGGVFSKLSARAEVEARAIRNARGVPIDGKTVKGDGHETLVLPLMCVPG
jgi:hypothetical protein